LMQEIKVTCQGADIMPIEALTPFQGRLKAMREEAFQKLKASILRYGITFPLFVWKNNGMTYTLDGHQRDIVLKRMRDEGFEIPLVPVDYIEAEGKKEAKEKILLLSSQYGRATPFSLSRYMEEAGIDVAEMAGMVEIPGLEIEKLVEAQDLDKPEVEFSEELLMEHNYVVLYFDNPIDWQVAVEKFGLHKVRDLIPRKLQPVGIGRVIRGAPWLERMK